jgi:hypothetical protein
LAARIVRALAEPPADAARVLFLAGGVSACPDWQADVARRLAPALHGWTIANPRVDDPPTDAEGVEKQIAWEFRHLHAARAVLFWLPPPTPCPISLYELGKVSMTDTPLLVGVHPEFPLRKDVLVQTRLARPDAVLVESLDELVAHALERLPDGHLP